MKIFYCLFIVICFLINHLPAQDSIYHRAITWDKTISEFRKEDAKRDSSKRPILFIGSSSFTRWTNLNSCFPNHEILNRGFGGSHASDIIYYAEQIIFSNKPAQILIYEGDNDLAGNMTVDEFLTDIKTLVRLIEIRLPGIPIAILSIKYSPSRHRYRDKYEAANVMLYEFARSKTHLTFIDVASLMIDAHGNYRKELFAEDMLHVNETAYQLWAERIRPVLTNNNTQTK
ncbi:MAG: GDSL-type esterase/lipase family protein [Paludibacter sp.]|nr:GDSL-type esterase/lipase family protein [Paludibacter sp.]